MYYVFPLLIPSRTFPPVNILLYNALGGHGDELYGTEPMSYYLKNLLLNLGPTLLLAVSLPVLLMLKYGARRMLKISFESSTSKQLLLYPHPYPSFYNCTVIFCMCIYRF